MPSNTFTHIGTTTVTGSSTTTVQFSGLGGYERVILVGQVRPVSGGVFACQINSSGSHTRTYMYAEGAQGAAVPITNIATSQTSIALTNSGLSADTNANCAFKILLVRDGNGKVYLNGEAVYYASSTNDAFQVTNGGKSVNLSSLTFLLGNGTAFAAGSIFSAYGLA